MAKKVILRCPICETIFKSHESAEIHADDTDHYGDYEFKKEPQKKCADIQKAFGVIVDSSCRDSNGEQIYFPKHGSHYDRALQKTFHSKKEKAKYMKDNNLIMDGSSDLHHRPIEAGDQRFSRVR
jgi:hypothetical protein